MSIYCGETGSQQLSRDSKNIIYAGFSTLEGT